jgi:hypothetical protein
MYCNGLRFVEGDLGESEFEAYWAAVEAEVAEELRLQDPVRQRFRYVCFVSKSKGRGRKRRNWVEVELVSESNGKRWTSFDKVPWDCKATEVFPNQDPREVERMLMDQVRRL